MNAQKHDPYRVALELREQLSSHTRRFGLLIGAGASMAAGLDGINGLTNKIGTKLEKGESAVYQKTLSELGERRTVEDALSRLDLYRELLTEDGTKEIDGFTYASANMLTRAVHSTIYQLLSIDPPLGLRPQMILAQFIKGIRRDYPVEVFCTNYDLLLERAMDDVGVPYFDGFVGSVSPFFAPDSVEATGEAESRDVYPPNSWTRIWKLHGSIGWYLKKTLDGTRRITRLPGHVPTEGEELVIWPSREKYVEARKVPFLSLLDRLRKFLASGECLLLVIGYACQDEHIMEMIFQGLRANLRLAVTAINHGTFGGRLESAARSHRNLSVYGPDYACIGGVCGTWSEPSRKRGEDEDWPFWDEKNRKFALGEFRSFADFLEQIIGLMPRETQSDDSSGRNPSTA
jgi:hypothetical protein